MAVPKVGDKIYVDSFLEADGGLATVSMIEKDGGVHFISIKEVGGRSERGSKREVSPHAGRAIAVPEKALRRVKIIIPSTLPLLSPLSNPFSDPGPLLSATPL